MKTCFPLISLKELLVPVERQEAPVPGKTYRQIGVKLWGEGAYAREPIDGSQTRYSKLYRVEANDIIVNRIWARRGSVAVVPSNLAGCYVSGEFPTFVPIEKRLDLRWFSLLTKTRFFWDQCEEKSRGASGKNRIRSERFLEIEIPLPSLSEQQRIGTLSEEIAARIEQARILHDEVIKESDMILDAVSRRILESPELKPFHVRIGDADLFHNRDHRDPARTDPEGEFLYVDISSVPPGPSTLRNAKRLPCRDAPSRARRVIHKDDVIISTVRPNLRAFAKIGEELDNQICSTGFAVFSCGSSVQPDFLLHQFCSSFFVDQCVAHSTGGHYPAINDTNLREVVIVVPPLPEQYRFAAYLNDIYAKVNVARHLRTESKTQLDTIFPSLLDRALSGKL